MAEQWGRAREQELRVDRAVIAEAMALGPVVFAAQAAQAVEGLVYATLPRAEGVGPGQVVEVLGELAALAELLPQLAEHLIAHLEAHALAVQASSAAPAAAAGVVSAVASVEYWLNQVGDLAAGLRQTWTHARAAAERLIGTDLT